MKNIIALVVVAATVVGCSDTNTPLAVDSGTRPDAPLGDPDARSGVDAAPGMDASADARQGTDAAPDSQAAPDGPQRPDGGNPPSDGGTDGGGACVPRSCAQLCGTAPNGCGGTIDCGETCSGSDTCGGGGIANRCGSGGPGGGVIDPTRATFWVPGVSYAPTSGPGRPVTPPAGWRSGIPRRTQVSAELSPRGPGLDDTEAINTALRSCPKEGVVKLTAGTFNINGNGLQFHSSYCTLRGAGSGTPGSGAGGTRLVRGRSETTQTALAR